jgi:hypothetical protein
MRVSGATSDKHRTPEDDVALDFVGMDENTPDEKCPAVYVDPATGDFYFQGRVVTDPVKLAEIAKHSPMAADETVIMQPARMGSIIAEAAAGTYEAGRLGHGPVSLLDLIKGSKHSAMHLEMRDVYDTNFQPFQDWLEGGSGRYDRSRWTAIVRDAVARGVRMRRARVVSEPVTDYIRWEHMLTDENLEAGEDVRWLPRRKAYDLLLPGTDLWLIDNRLVAFNFCEGDGTDTEEEVFTSDPEVVARCLLAFEQVWDRATPHADYLLS